MRRPAERVTFLALLLAGALSCAKDPEPRDEAAERARLLGELAAIDGLELRGGPEAAVALAAVLREGSPVARARAARALGRILPPRDPAPLIQALADEEGMVRAEAGFALGRTGAASAVPPLLAAAAQDPEPGVRAASIEALGWFPGVPQSAWEAALADGDHRVQRQAVLAAARTDPPPGAAWWPGRIDGTRDERVRWAAFAAIASRPELALALADRLIAAAGDPNFLVSTHAFLALRGNASPAVQARRDLVAGDPRRPWVEREAALGSSPPGRLLARWGGNWPAPLPPPFPYPPPYPLLGPGGAPRIRNPRAAIRIAGRGTILLDLFAADAPHHVSSFLELARRGWYAGRRIVDVDPTVGILVAEAAPPAAGGATQPDSLAGAPLPGEVHFRSILRGSVLSPPSAGSLLIAHLPLPFLEGRTTCWGAVVLGMEILDAIQAGDTIEAIEPR